MNGIRIIDAGRCLPFLLIVLGIGCAQTAKKTPTPAAEVRAVDLEREPVPPGEHYYALLFGSQSRPMVPRLTHTWATVVRVVEQDGQGPVVEPSTISWMPATLEIHSYRLRVEPGRNLDLYESLQIMSEKNERIAMWGPFAIRPGLYRKIMMQKQFMESGQVGYQCIDSAGEAARCGSGCDCIHAITDADAEFDRGTYWLFRYGERASRFIVDQVGVREQFINPCHTHDWLICKLGLDQFPIERRAWHGPRLAARWAAQLRQNTQSHSE